MSSSRVLGADAGTAAAVDRAPGETTTLLGGPSRRIRVKSQPRFNRTTRLGPSQEWEDAVNGSTGEPQRTAHQHRRTPQLLRLAFLLSSALLLANLCGVVLVGASTTSNLVAYYALPPHYGSTFLPFLLVLLGATTNVLSLLSLVIPTSAPHLGLASSWINAALIAIISILVVAVGELRRKENVLTLVVLGLVWLSAVLAALSTSFVEKHHLNEESDDEDDADAISTSPGSFRITAYQWTVRTFSFLSLTLPLVILHGLITLTLLLLLLSVTLRAIDASAVYEGQLWTVNPWARHGGRDGSVGNSVGRSYKIHLDCRGTEPFATLNQTLQTERARRTILLESRQGVPGRNDARWVLDMLEQGALTSPDHEVRVCYWDRPGYGFSDSSTTASIPHLVTALTEALSLSGELARITPAVSLPPAYPGLVRSGFVLVAREYGVVSSVLFAARNPTLIHSALYLSPTPPTLYYAPRPRDSTIRHRLSYFVHDVLGSWYTELGVKRFLTTARDGFRGRADRVLSTEQDGIRGEIMRSLRLEDKTQHKPTGFSAKNWSKFKSFYPDKRDSIVLSTNATLQQGYDGDDWARGQKDFEGMLGKGLRRWEHSWEGQRGCAGKGGAACRESLLELLALD